MTDHTPTPPPQPNSRAAQFVEDYQGLAHSVSAARSIFGRALKDIRDLESELEIMKRALNNLVSVGLHQEAEASALRERVEAEKKLMESRGWCLIDEWPEWNSLRDFFVPRNERYSDQIRAASGSASERGKGL